MGTFTKPIDLYNHQKRRFEKVILTATGAMEDMAKAGAGDFKEFTSGSITSAKLRQMGHPYGRGSSAATRTATGLMRGAKSARAKKIIGRSQVPLLPINRQSGQLQDGIFVRRAKKRSWDVVSSSKHQYVLWPAGTGKMVGRGLLGGRDKGFKNAGVLEKRFRARNKAFVDVFMKMQRKT